MDNPPAAHADPADVDSLDAIVNTLYASVSFAAGQRPDWQRFRSLFRAEAVLVRVDPLLTGAGGGKVASGAPTHGTQEPLRVSSIEDFVARTNAAIDSGALSAFTERELSRRTEVFADVAQVFSSYERSADAGEVHRGINSVQLVKDGERWWVVSLSWTDETDAGPLPSRYLPRS